MANITGFLKKSFPFISAAASFGGPLGALAAAAVGKALGVDGAIKPDLDSIASYIAGATPEQLIELRKAEADLQAKLAELGYQNEQELSKIAEEDRESARGREIAVKDKMPRYLAGLVVLACAAGEGFVLVHGSPPNVPGELVGRILGTLDAAVMLVLSYYFGSSAGSDRKTEIMANGSGK